MDCSWTMIAGLSASQHKPDDRWPESVEEQVIQLLVWRQFSKFNEYIKRIKDDHQKEESDDVWRCTQTFLITGARCYPTCTHAFLQKCFYGYTQTAQTNTLTHRQTHTHTHRHPRARTRTRAHAHAHTHTPTQTHTHTYTHTHTLRNTPKGEDEMRWNENSWFRLLGFRLSPVAIQESFKLQTKFYAGTRIGVPILFQLISVASWHGWEISLRAPCSLIPKNKQTNVLIWRCNEAPDSKCESCIEFHNAAVSEIVQFMSQSVVWCYVRMKMQWSRFKI